MPVFTKSFEPIWADMDPNMHMRHTAYNDYAAQVRVAFMMENGFDASAMARLHIGPVLFREETRFVREVRMGEVITIDVMLGGLSREGQRWRLVHRIVKGNGKEAAVITVEGAWIDLTTRKLTSPPQGLIESFNKLDKTGDFREI